MVQETSDDFCASALSAEVAIELPSLLAPYGTSFQLSVAAPYRLLISLNGHSETLLTAALSALVQMMSRHAEVTWIEPRFPPKPLLRYAKQLVRMLCRVVRYCVFIDCVVCVRVICNFCFVFVCLTKI